MIDLCCFPFNFIDDQSHWRHEIYFISFANNWARYRLFFPPSDFSVSILAQEANTGSKSVHQTHRRTGCDFLHHTKNRMYITFENLRGMEVWIFCQLNMTESGKIVSCCSTPFKFCVFALIQQVSEDIFSKEELNWALPKSMRTHWCEDATECFKGRRISNKTRGEVLSHTGVLPTNQTTCPPEEVGREILAQQRQFEASFLELVSCLCQIGHWTQATCIPEVYAWPVLPSFKIPQVQLSSQFTPN